MKKSKSKFADRGKEAESAVQEYLEWWVARSVHREYNRLPDTKAAGRTIKAAPADFDFYSMVQDDSFFGLLEVKETEHEYRIGRDKITQLPRMRKRAKCGGKCPILIWHSTINKWRVVMAPHLMEFGDKGSWNLAGFPTYDSASEALHSELPYIFEIKE
jgi:hypothetical protein